MHSKSKSPRLRPRHQPHQHPRAFLFQRQPYKVFICSPPTHRISGQIQVSLTSLSRTIDDYDNMAKREIIAAKQEKAFSYTL
jgi:hypothetical protein